LKKIAAILLLFVFLFNLIGYQFLIAALQQKVDIALETLIDNNEYDETQLTEMRVSLNMPYQQRYTEFERHYGEINIDGKIYTYVKRKIEGDVLILKCIPNTSKTLLQEAGNNYTASNNGANPANGKEIPYKPQAKKAAFDFEGKTYFPELASREISTRFYSEFNAGNIPDVLLPVDIQPPSL
jgi:hypothetical protein